MAAFTGMTLALAILGLALVTGCGGRASSPGLDTNAGGASDGGNGAVQTTSEAGSTSDQAAGGAVRADSPSSVSNVAGAAQADSPSSVGNGAGAPAVVGGGGGAAMVGGGGGAAVVGGGGGAAMVGGGGGAAVVGGGGGAAVVGGGGGAAGSESGPFGVTAACTKLCSGWIHGCNIWEFPKTCPNDCASDLAVQNGACTDLGLSMLTCMTATNGTTNDNLCTTPFMLGIAACRAQAEAFRACTLGGGSGPLTKICMHAGSPFSGGCSENEYCLDDQSYTLRCADAAGSSSSCTCSGYNTNTKLSSTIDVSFDEPSDKVCLNHLADCIASVNPAP